MWRHGYRGSQVACASRRDIEYCKSTGEMAGWGQRTRCGNTFACLYVPSPSHISRFGCSQVICTVLHLLVFFFRMKNSVLVLKLLRFPYTQNQAANKEDDAHCEALRHFCITAVLWGNCEYAKIHISNFFCTTL